MGTSIRNNMLAVSIVNILNRNDALRARCAMRISSGMRINSASDDPSGYAISERMRVRLRCLEQSRRNVQSSRSLLKCAEGGMQNSIDIMTTMKEIALRCANGIYTDRDRRIMEEEFKGYLDEINHISSSTNFNSKNLLDGTYQDKENSDDDNSKFLHLQTGPDAGDGINIFLNGTDCNSLGIEKLSVLTQDKAKDAIDKLDAALESAIGQNAKIGAYINRMDYCEANIMTEYENLTDAESTIRDADMAKEITAYTKYQILTQVAQAMLAQANHKDDFILDMLKKL